MGVFSKLFGSGDTINKGMDLIDEAFHTDQEKTEQKVKLLQAYEAFKVAQRLFMLSVVMPYMFLWSIIGIATFVVDCMNMDFTASRAYLIEGQVIYLVMLMAGFYFGDTLAGKFMNRLK